MNRYLVAVLVTAAAVAARLALAETLGLTTHPFVVLFCGAAVVAAWYGGFRAGLLSTGLGTLAVTFLFIEPKYSFRIERGDDLTLLLSYITISLGGSWLCENLHAARRQVVAATAVIAEQGERLRTTLASIGDAVITTDLAGCIINMNAVAETLTGWTSDEAAGEPLDAVFRIVNETSRQPVENPAIRALKEGVIVGLANHTVLIAKDGTERPIDDSAAPIRCKVGELVGCVLVFRDISERHRQEAELRDRERQFRTLAESIPQLAWMANPDGHIFWYNRRWYDYTGTTLEQMEGWGWQSVHDPDELSKVLERWKGSIASGQSFDMVFPLKGKDGVFRPFLTRVEPVKDDEGRVVRWFGTNTDITEQKETEGRLQQAAERFRSLVTATAQVVWTTAPDGLVVEDSPTWRAFTGQTYDEWKGWGWLDAIHPDDREQAAKVWSEAVAGKTICRMDYRVRAADGSYRWTAVRGVPVLRADGGIREWIGMNTDVSDRKRAEDALRRRETFISGVLGSITDAFYAVDLNWRFTFVNDEIVRRFGRPRSEIVGGHVWEMFPDAVGSIAHVQLHRAMADRVAVEYEIFYEPWRRWFLDKAFPTDDGGLAVYSRDITSSKETEEARRHVEERFRLAAEAVNGIIYEFDFQTGTVERTRGLYEVVGYRTDEVPATAAWWWDQTHPDDREASRRRFEEMAGGNSILSEYRVRHKDGRWLHVEDRAVLLRDDAGKPVKMIGCTVDVTGPKTQREALAASEGRFRELADAMPQIVYTTDADGKIAFINRQWIDYTGQAEAQTADLGPVVHPDDLGDMLRRWEQSAASGTALQTEFRLRRATDGEYRWFLTRAVPVRDRGGRVVQWFGTSTDVHDSKQAETALKASEVRYRRLFESAKDGILILDAHAATITDANPFIAEMLDYSQDEFVGKELWQIGLFKDVEASKAAMRELQEQGYIRYEDLPLETKTGRRINVEFVSNVYGENGEAVIQCNVRDMTDRKRLEDRLRQHAAELSEADRRKDEFLATLAHELRNPLAPIRNGLQVIRLAGVDGTVEQARIMMERQLTQMVRLVDDLLDVSRITRGKLELRTGRVELKAVIAAAVETSRPVIEQVGHEFVAAVPDEPIFVDGDATRLAQVVSNLLNNSAKYTHRGGHISLAVGREEGMAVVSVKDDGIGIPPAMLDKVFVMFTQVDRTLEKTTGGLGIGLSLVRGLVEMHGGTIEARSEGEGKGSEFVVRLPVVTPGAVGADHSDKKDEEIAATGLRRILVVDDNADSADSLGQLLEMLGNEVRTAYDGEAGVAEATEFRPDVVLMDIGMPKLNGYEACRRIREQPWAADMVLVALTGWGQEDDRQKSADAGFDHHLVKPVDPQSLMKMLAGLPTGTQ